jgi:hypothetical protein
MSTWTLTSLFGSPEFWDDNFWLPPNVTWKDLKARESEVAYASFGDLSYPLVLAWAVVVIRKAIEKWVLRPLGRQMGISDTRPDPVPRKRIHVR